MKVYNIDELLALVSEAKKGVLQAELCIKYDISTTTLNKILRDNNIRRDVTCLSSVKNHLGVKKTRKTRSSSNRVEFEYLVGCSCGKENWIPHHVAIRLYKRKDKYLCDKCSKSFDIRCPRASMQKKRKDNTTGYIGVTVKKDHRDNSIWGYQAVINSKGNKVFDNRYKDYDLYEKTLIQAVVDRDVFIINHSLPHRRNLADKELLSEMQFLAHEEVNNIKTLLENKI